MNDAYQILGLQPGADPATIRSTYLKLVRQFTPDNAPQRFAEIHTAYEQIRDPVARLHRQIFQESDVSLDDILDALRHRIRETRLPVDKLISLAEHR